MTVKLMEMSEGVLYSTVQYIYTTGVEVVTYQW